MGLVSAITASLLLWLVLWALGWKAIDGLMLGLCIVLVGVVVRMLLPHLPSRREY